jgi:hypothetical protein
MYRTYSFQDIELTSCPFFFRSVALAVNNNEFEGFIPQSIWNNENMRGR